MLELMSPPPSVFRSKNVNVDVTITKIEFDGKITIITKINDFLSEYSSLDKLKVDGTVNI